MRETGVEAHVGHCCNVRLKCVRIAPITIIDQNATRTVLGCRLNGRGQHVRHCAVGRFRPVDVALPGTCIAICTGNEFRDIEADRGRRQLDDRLAPRIAELKLNHGRRIHTHTGDHGVDLRRARNGHTGSRARRSGRPRWACWTRWPGWAIVAVAGRKREQRHCNEFAALSSQSTVTSNTHRNYPPISIPAPADGRCAMSTHISQRLVYIETLTQMRAPRNLHVAVMLRFTPRCRMPPTSTERLRSTSD